MTTTPLNRRRWLPRPVWWDRAAILLLGAAGCALSYDALRQMAFAIHVRPALTWLFPIVIDGFIAYGVRALLVLRGAPFRARAYVWTLFAAATATSVWANALHAIRLNQTTPASELHLSDRVVGLLSVVAPLALAGATHLFILISRHAHQTDQLSVGTAAHEPAGPLNEEAGTAWSALPASATGAGTAAAMIPAVPVKPGQPGPAGDAATTETVPDITAGTALAETPATVPGTGSMLAAEGTVAVESNPVPAGHRADGDSGGAVRAARLGRPADASIPELAQVLGTVPVEGGRITRAKARNAIGAAGLSAGNERIKEALQLLDPGPSALPHPDAD
ncbi:hypothetical protein ABIA32_000976 [Streptacidiphilus sp. MAP12-20]|uniref:DUF2637 domain-containing protein n=1 Tax=Streptacidiphilus sp. MAP12-20 TaxID=3156299 RepID=UPI003514CA86